MKLSLGLKENLTIAQVNQRGEMESDEGKLHKLSMGYGRIGSSFSDMSISSGGGGFSSGSGFGHPPSSATAPSKGLGMQLGKSQRTNQFLEFTRRSETGGNPAILFNIYPNMNKELHQ
ncbi:hypothetical protein Pint_12164 [Pistacia integerrima]|uniref:Uncharacterized protein n=1 Tax=Pistacia integerrima TaxID=434235 RepID=A0ACC0XIX9_9ROSI|nr:hypothetical protein Pint_12164 [Pistacia integerrima]